MIEHLNSQQFWITLIQIAVISVALSGNNAMVIALAARSVPAERRQQMVLWGSVVAIAIRVVLAVIAFHMLQLPYIKIVGGVALFWIAIQLLVPDLGLAQPQERSRSPFASAGYVIVLANLSMSFDTVLGIAAAAADDALMLTAGLTISALVILFGSSFVVRMVARIQSIYIVCAVLLSYLAGRMIISDAAILGWVHGHLPAWQDINIGPLTFSRWGLAAAATAWPLAKLIGFIKVLQQGARDAEAGNADGETLFSKFAGLLKPGTQPSLTALLPIAAVILVVFLGHPLFSYTKTRLTPQIGYYDINLGMTQDDVAYAKGRPVDVVINNKSNRQQLVALNDIPPGRSLNDFSEWVFPLAPEEKGSLEIVFSENNRHVVQVGCFSQTNHCKPLYGIATGSTEHQVIETLGKPHNIKMNRVTVTFEYPDLHLSLLIKNRHVVMVRVRNFDEPLLAWE